MGFFLGFAFQKLENDKKTFLVEEDVYLRFLGEIYEKIKQNYWEKIDDELLSNIFKLAVEKLTQKPQTLIKKDDEGVKILIKKITKNMDIQKKKEFVVSLGDMVLQNLSPFGRSRLYTIKKKRN